MSATIITIIAIVTLLITAAAAVGGSFRVARNTAVIADYRQAYEGVKAKADGQEIKITELTAHLAERDSQIRGLQGKVSVLQDVVTSKSAIEDMTRRVTELAAKFDDRAIKVDARIGEVLALVGGLRGEVTAAHTAILGEITQGKGTT